MEIVRTDDRHFDGLPGFAFAPHYLDWDGLRTHYLDVGPRDAPVALLLHGEPTWSFLYRKMIGPLVDAGYRCVVPDHIGFGRSDKVVDERWYTIDRHVDRLRGFIERLDLQGVTAVVQDWGGPIGLINVAEAPERFARLVILNTWLHHPGFVYTPAIAAWREAATSRYWLGWLGGDLPCGRIVAKALLRMPADPAGIVRAYEAPYADGPAAKAGARRFPFCLPFAEPAAGAAERQAAALSTLERVRKRPAHVIFADSDVNFTVDWGRAFAARLSNASFDVIERAGHFVQEDAGAEVVAAFLRRRDAAVSVTAGR
jgi:haloalkane dehalogenase